MASIDLNHAIGPFSRVLKITSQGPAFFLFPHNDSEPNGWGSPWVDSKGKPVPPPGTPVSEGGANPYRKLAWRASESAWKLKRKPGNWVYGNIDWRGPVHPRSSDPNYRIKLNYHGPQARYFASPNFSYGSDSKHNDIYQNGSYADIAPYPVLGAALTTFQDDKGKDVEYIVAVCKYGVEDIVFIRKRQPTIAPDSLDEATRAQRMQVFDAKTAPDGWKQILRIPQQSDSGETAQSARTPWFFSEDGRKAQCMRATSKNFDNGKGPTTESGLFRYKITITSPDTASFLNYLNTPGFTYSDTTVKDSYPHIKVNQLYGYDPSLTGEQYYPDCAVCLQPDYIYDVRVPGQNFLTAHYFAVDHYKSDLTMKGEYYVGVDYYGNDEILIKVKYDMDYGYEKWWRYNIDHYMSYVGGLGDLRPWNVDARQATVTTSDTSYFDQPIDGWRWEYWSWYDVNGNPTDHVNCRVCGSTLDSGETYSEALQQYIQAGGEVPPETVYYSEAQLAQYRIFGGITLEWTHPTGGDQKLQIGKWDTGSRDIFIGGILVQSNILDSRTTYTAQVEFLDARLPEGPLVISRAETINNSNMGVVKVYHPYYTTGLHRDGSLYGPTQEFHYDWYTFAQRADKKEYVTYEMVDPISDPASAKILAMEEGDEYSEQDVKEKMHLDDIQVWNPTGADTVGLSPNHPIAADVGVDWNHDWRRYDFSWGFSLLSIDGRRPSKADYSGYGLEPHMDDWVEAYGSLEWPSWSNLLEKAGTNMNVGVAWLDQKAVCASFSYKKGASTKPVTNPTPDALKNVFYVNYLTDDELDGVEPPATRYYPIGVE